MGATIKGGVSWSFASTSVGAITQLLYLYVLATWGGPEVVGLYSLLAAFQSIAFALQDGGLLTYYIHRQELKPEEQSALFWLAVITGVIAAVALLGVAPALVGIYDAPGLMVPLVLIAIQILVLAFSSQCQAHLMKQLSLGRLARIEILGRVISLVALFVFCIYEPEGSQLLVCVFGSILIGGLVRSAGVMLSCAGLPAQAFSVRPDWAITKPAVRYTGYHLGAQLINQFRANVDVLILAKLLGVELTGVYAVAKEAVLKPSRVIQPVIARVLTPAFARAQGSAEDQSLLYLRSLNLCSLANGVVFAGLAIAGPWVITTVLGESYFMSGVLVALLSVWGFCRSLGAPSASLAYANGRSEIDFYWNISILPITVLVIAVGTLGSDLRVLAVVLVTFQLLIMCSTYVVFVRRLLKDITFTAFVSQWWKPFLTVVVCAAVSYSIL